MHGVDAIVTERIKQVEVYRYDAAHDAVHHKCELLAGAACYMLLAKHQAMGHTPIVKRLMAEAPKDWPFAPSQWKPNGVAKNNLRKAGAMIAAEWDRLDRMGM